MLNKLFNQKEFSQIIEYYNRNKSKKLSESEYLIVTKSYFELNEYETVKKLVNEYIYEHKFYYEYLLLKIKILIIEEKYNDAAIIIREELNMPYIDLKYKNQFEEELELIIYKTYKQKVSDKDIEEIIYSENKDNRILALSLLRNQNLRNYTDLLKNILMDSDFDLSFKNLLIEIFYEQSIFGDYELSFDSFYEIININNYIDNKNKLFNSLINLAISEYDDQVIISSFKEVLTVILLNTYPIDDISIKMYFQTIDVLVKQMFNIDVVDNTFNVDLLDYFKSLVY